MMQASLEHTPEPPSDGQRVAAAVDTWKRKLLDLSMRNRALNFKVNKVSTVTIVDEQPAEVFRRLVLEEKPMRFRPASESPSVAPVAETPGAPDTEAASEDEGDAPSLEFTPYSTGDLAERYTDDVLETNSTPDHLDRALRRLDEQARGTLEEQGVNVLFLALGMLHYRESPASEQSVRAPLILLPVALDRGSAKAGYMVRTIGEDPMVNPALAEWLRRGPGITLPELPDPASMPESYDLQEFLAGTAQVIAGHEGWSVKTDIFLALFSFQKFVMYKDLEANGARYAGHRLIHQLVTRSGSQIRGLPEDVRALELDREYAPESTAQVVDADGSQLRAVAAVSRGHDLVLEGPPGTGKSQTITNLVAGALGAGKSVLFVAEKMAALDVVHTRLAEAGLGEFCLELHSTKANKRAVMQEIAAALDASLQRPQVAESVADRLGTVRHTLTEYAQAVHTPHGTLGISPYRAYGELGRVRGAPKVRLSQPIDQISRAELDDAVRSLGDLAVAAGALGNPLESPWRDSHRTFYSEYELDTAAAILRTLHRELARAEALASEVERAFGIPPIRRLDDLLTAIAVTQVMARSPGAPLAVLKSDAWNSAPPEARSTLELGRRVAELRERIESRFTPEVIEREHRDDADFIEAKENSPFRFLNFLNGRFRAIKRRWLAYRQPAYAAPLVEQVEEMRRVDALVRERRALAERERSAQELFGALWRGEESDWDALDGYIRWVVEFRSMCVTHGLAEQAVAVASRAEPDLGPVVALEDAAGAVRDHLREIRRLIEWPDDYLAELPLPEIRARVEALQSEPRGAVPWATFEAARQSVAAGPAAEMLEFAAREEVPFSHLVPAYLRAFYQQWLSELVQAREPLRAFHTLTHEERIAEFRALDERVLRENRATLVAGLRDTVQARLRTPEAVEAMPTLRRELARQRGLSPLRRTLKSAGAAVRAIKPCFMMSPLTVAQLLDGDFPPFDLVVFDEASQLPVEDAVGAVVRGKQLVVVGDPKQLPPTNFFAVQAGQVTVTLDADGTPLYEDSESILEEFMGSGVPSTRLKWHYRSAHESLINFSNVSFYDSDLYTFPSVVTDAHRSGLQFEHVPEGVYEGKGLNLAEARRVVDAVVEHAKATPELSLGVGTFNLRQQLAILDELELRRRRDPAIEPFFARGKDEPFFVKNLENIQGDERDVIFLSVTYGKDRDGKLRYNFGPINGENGWRRLNVITTRARKRMRVFSSMRGDDINPAQTTSTGARLLRDFLLYAERGRLESVAATAAAETESPFEREVYHALTERGIRLQPQVGVAGYRIDLGVLDDAVAGRYLCGIECDGAAYHSSETARDRDRLRQQVLEARGWTIHRLWSTDWFKDRDGQIGRLLGLIERSRIEALEQEKEEAEARKRATELAARAAEETEALSSAHAPGEAEEGAGRESPGVDRPTAALPYTMADGANRYAGADLTQAPLRTVVQAALEVITAEAPLHISDLASRLAAMWGAARVGARIFERVQQACRMAEREGEVENRGEYVWPRSGEFAVRSRAGTGIPAERIPPEEFREAALMVLRAEGALDRKRLTAEVRALFGYSRTGARLEEAISSAIEHLLATGTVGEGSAGIALRA